MRVEKRELPDRGGIGDTDLRVEPIQLWGRRDSPSPKATLNGQSLLQFAPLSNKNFSKTGVGVNCNGFFISHLHRLVFD